MSLLRLPGLIDPHVHLREPGETYKEDFDTGTAAALAGGFTAVLAMPNTNPPLTDRESLELALTAARQKARCDYGIYLAGSDDNSQTTPGLARLVCGLKLYLDHTYGPLRIGGLEALMAQFLTWPADRPLAVHAEGRTLAAAVLLAMLFERAVHLCHVSRKEEIELIRAAKAKGAAITCEVTPHHMFLTREDARALGDGLSQVRPPLGRPEDIEALWANLAVIDCFATDHAPHTLSEKTGDDPPPGFPGLETAAGLWLTALHDGRLTQAELRDKLIENPRRIFQLPDQEETYVEIDPEQRWTVRASEQNTRCGWSPFEGMRLRGRVQRVVLRGKLACEQGQVVARGGEGRNLFQG